MDTRLDGRAAHGHVPLRRVHHADDPLAVLPEMARIVEPGGTVAVVDAVEHPYWWMREEHADV